MVNYYEIKFKKLLKTIYSMKAMKFTVHASKSSLGRRGAISDLPRIPGLTIETPAIMMYTKGASIPHLTHEVLQMLTSDLFLMETPLLSTLHMVPGVKAQGEGVAQFCGLGEYPRFMMLQDPTAAHPYSSTESLKVPLWTRKGRIQMDADGYMDTVECFKPDLYSAFCDGFTDSTSSKKRVTKSAAGSAAMLARCIQRHFQSEYLSQNTSLLGVIEGGHSTEERKRCAESVAAVSDKLGGFILDGVTHDGPLIEEYQKHQLEPFLQDITTLLPENKVRVAAGCWNAVTLLHLVASGWDLFDTSAAYQTTERFHALSFRFKLDVKSDANMEYEMNLQDKIYKEDFGPLVDGCTCLACRKHSRAYIYHLTNTRELLSSVLLMIHNLHHYIEFFKEIRQCIATEKMVQLHNLVDEQYQRRVKPASTRTGSDAAKSKRLPVDSLSVDKSEDDRLPKRTVEI